jgi:hypothetical protein
MPAAGLDLSSSSTGYAGLVNVPSTQCTPTKMRVLPGNSNSSYLINKLTGLNMCFGSKMPKTGTLSQAEIDTVRAWIDSGAGP